MIDLNDAATPSLPAVVVFVFQQDPTTPKPKFTVGEMTPEQHKALTEAFNSGKFQVIDFNDALPQRPPLEDAAIKRDRILKALQGRIHELVRYLYPHATFWGRDARIGDATGAKGASMSISLADDETAGRWIDHATGQKGDAFSLFAIATGLDGRGDFGSVMTECERWLGGTPSAAIQIMHQMKKAKQPDTPKPKRTKTLDTSYVYRTKEGQEWGFEQRRYRYTDNGEKTYLPFWNGNPGMPPDGRPLYNLNRWHAEPVVVVVEGEKCVDALASIGIPATTLMGGANTSVEKTDLTPLAGKEVILWPDNDAPGMALMTHLQGPLRAMGCTGLTLAPPEGKPPKWDAADAIAEGFDVIGFLRAPATPEKPRLPILDVPGLLNVPDPTWIIDGWVIDDGTSVFYGPPKTYKTFNVLDMALSVACGVPWRGNSVVQQPVLYLLGEGMGTFKYRVHVWLAKRSEGRQAQFWTIPVGVPLSTPEGLANALAAIDSLPNRPGMIVIDTLNRHFGPGDENSSQDMTRFVQAIDAIRAHTRAHICIVHHSGKDADKGARGSSALLGAVDNEFRITRTEGTQLCRIECTAARHSDEPKPMTVELVKVEVTHPETGLVMSSLLPVLRDDGEGQDSAPNSPRQTYRGPYLAIIKMLQDAPLSTWEVANALGVERSNAGKKLRTLEQDGAIFSRDDGNRKVWVAIAHDLPTGDE